MASGLSNKSVHLAQAQACPLSYAFCCKERIEGLFNNVRRHPCTGIRDSDEHVLTRPHRVLLGIHIVDECVLSFDREFPPTGHRVARIYCEIEDRILELRWVGFNLPQAGSKHGFYLDLLSQGSSEQLAHARDKLVGT